MLWKGLFYLSNDGNCMLIRLYIENERQLKVNYKNNKVGVGD